MASAADVLLGRILVRNRLVSKEQVDACLTEVNAETSANGGLAGALVRRRLVPMDQIEKARHAAALLQARRYLKFAQELGFVSQENTDEVLVAYRASGYTQTVAHILQAQGKINAAQNEAIIGRDPMFLGDARSAFSAPAPNKARISTAGIPVAPGVGPSPLARKTGSFQVVFESGAYQRPDFQDPRYAGPAPAAPEEPKAPVAEGPPAPAPARSEPPKRTQLQVAFDLEGGEPRAEVPPPEPSAPEAVSTEPPTEPPEPAPEPIVLAPGEAVPGADSEKRTMLQAALPRPRPRRRARARARRLRPQQLPSPGPAPRDRVPS